MTDLETLLRDTFAAHESLADPQATPVRQAARTRSALLAVLAVAATLVLAAGVVVALRADGPEPAPTNRKTSSTRPTLPDFQQIQRQYVARAASRLLGTVAERLASYPGGIQPIEPDQARSLADLTTYLPADDYRVVQTRYWTTDVPDPSQVVGWFAAHAPDGLYGASDPRRIDRPGEIAREELAFGLATRGPTEDTTQILLQAVPLDGGTALRATVYYRVPGPLVVQPLEGPITDATITWDESEVHVTDAGDLRRLTNTYGHLTVQEPDVSRCWHVTTADITITLATAGEQLQATANGCGGWHVTKGDQQVGPDLADRNELLMLAKQLVVAGS